MLNMPNIVIQNHIDRLSIDGKNYYRINWDNVSQQFGSFRTLGEIRDNIAQNRRDVIRIINAAYKATFRNFQECLDFCRERGIEVYNIRNSPRICEEKRVI